MTSRAARFNSFLFYFPFNKYLSNLELNLILLVITEGEGESTWGSGRESDLMVAFVARVELN